MLLLFSTYSNRFFCVGRQKPGLYIKCLLLGLRSDLESSPVSNTLRVLFSNRIRFTPKWVILANSSDVSFSCYDLTGTSEVRGGEGHGAQDQRLWLPGVLSQDQGWREGGVWDGHQGSATGQETMQERRLRSALKLQLQLTQGCGGVGGGGGRSQPRKNVPHLCLRCHRFGLRWWSITGMMEESQTRPKPKRESYMQKIMGLYTCSSEAIIFSFHKKKKKVKCGFWIH